jgi:hypothetical protein
VIFFYLISDQCLSSFDEPKLLAARSLPPVSPKIAYSYSHIEENLQCALCIDRLRDPRALPCQHVFCCSCLRSVPSSHVPYPSIVCPLCRRSFPFQNADQLPVSLIHRQLLELVPKNYDINGKCTRCQAKTSLILCSCCDYLLCQQCHNNDREKILDNIQHSVQICSYRLNRIHCTRDRLNDLKEQNQQKIQQVEVLFRDLERKIVEHKHRILSSLQRYTTQVEERFWSLLNLPIKTRTEPFTNILKEAESLLKKFDSTSFEDVLTSFYNLSSIEEKLEHANSLINTCDIQNLFKQSIQLCDRSADEQIRIRFKQQNAIDEQVFLLLPPSILPRSAKRLRKTEPKKHVESLDDDHADNTADINPNCLPVCKRMKRESEHDIDSNPSPSSCIYLHPSSNEQQRPCHDQADNDEIIYLQTIGAKSPNTINFEELFQIINTVD